MLRNYKNKKLGLKSVAVMVLGSIVFSIGCDDKKSDKSEKFAEIFAAKLEGAKQNFTMNAGTGGTITGEDGVILNCDADAFLNVNGDPISENVDIEMVEALKVGDMLALNKQTVGDDNGTLRVLTSGGQIYLNATMGGEQLTIAEDACTLKFPTTDFDSSMKVFVGEENDNGDLIWKNTGQSVALPSMIAGGGDFEEDFYTLQVPSPTSWINCDYFNSWTESTLTEVSINVPEGHDMDNTRVWAVFPSINSVAIVRAYEDGAFKIKNGYRVPVGFEIKLVALTINEDDTYTSSFSTITVTENMVTSLEFQPTTLEQFDTAAQGL